MADFTGDDKNINDKTVIVGPAWTGHPMFSNMDSPPGTGGAIGIADIDGNKPEDIAVAAHEAFHAKLQLHKKNFENEHVVNRLAIRWLQDHLSGMFLHMATERLLRSKRSYQSFKYDSTKKWLAKNKKYYD